VIRSFKALLDTLALLPDYFRAIAKQWTNILFGEGLVAVVFLVWWALGSPPLVLIFVSAMFVAGYYAWREEHIAAHQKQTPEKPANVLRRDWNGDWKDLANEFRGYAGHTLRADWYHTSAGEAWRICGGAEFSIVCAVEILCRNAGRLLVSSPNVSASLPADIKTLSDPMERWLYYMKKKGTFYRSGFVGTEQLNDGTIFHAYSGNINSLPNAASNECLDCAGQEF